MRERLVRLGLVTLGLAIVAWFGWRHWMPPGLAGVLALVLAGLAFLFLLQLRDPDRYSTRAHAWESVAHTVVITWAISLAVTMGFDQWASKEAHEKQGLPGLILLVAMNVGGFLALTRSVRTRSETGATLRELSNIRVATLSTPVVEEAVLVFEAADVSELVGSVARMLRLAVSLPLLRELLDSSVLWVRDEKNAIWFILASSDLSETDLAFTMPVLETEQAGAGIVANLAVASPPTLDDCLFKKDVFVCRKGLRAHPWYVANKGSSADAMAAVILRDGGEVVGVLSLTTGATDALPLEDPQHGELIDILRFWSHSFLIPIRRLRELRTGEPT